MSSGKLECAWPSQALTLVFYCANKHSTSVLPSTKFYQNIFFLICVSTKGNSNGLPPASTTPPPVCYRTHESYSLQLPPPLYQKINHVIISRQKFCIFTMATLARETNRSWFAEKTCFYRNNGNTPKKDEKRSTGTL